MASSAAAAGRSLALQACPWHRSPFLQTQGISNMGCHNGWILQQKRGMVNWDKISASKGAPQPPAYVPPPLPPPSPSPSGPPAAQAPGTPPPLATAATLSEEEARAKLEELLSEPYLAVQRRLEMANLIIGFEQVFMSSLVRSHVHSSALSAVNPTTRCFARDARHANIALNEARVSRHFTHSGVCVRPCVPVRLISLVLEN
jgi:hypothetical protein